MIIAGVLAGGKGERLGGSTAKQFLEMDGKPMVAFPLEVFCSIQEIDEVIVACNPDYLKSMEGIVASIGTGSEKIRITLGGSTRHESVMNILRLIYAKPAQAGDKFILHEAARPLLDADTVHRHITELEQHEATNTLFPVIDTIMISRDGEYIAEVPDKRMTYIGQNPQGYELIALLQRLGGDINLVDNPDDVDLCSLFMQNGGKVKIVPGNERLFKVTYPADLDLMRRYIK